MVQYHNVNPDGLWLCLAARKNEISPLLPVKISHHIGDRASDLER